MHIVLTVLDWLLFLFHTALVIFNMLGWIWRRTRVLHLVVLGCTAFSWFVLGAFWGWGYCIITDWHAQIRGQLGHEVRDTTFVQEFVEFFFRISLDRSHADFIAASVFVFIVLATVIVWGRAWCRRKYDLRGKI